MISENKVDRTNCEYFHHSCQNFQQPFNFPISLL